MNRDKKQLPAKVVIIGDTGVGKSSIAIRFVFDKFDLKQQATLGAAYMEKICHFYYVESKGKDRKFSKESKESKINKENKESRVENSGGKGEKRKENNQKIIIHQPKNNYHILKLQIWDTAGQQKYQAIAKLYYRDCRFAILVYDIIRRQSFQNMKKWYRELVKHAPKDIRLAVVGNKIDLLELTIDQNPVSYKEGEEFAKQINAIFAEVSAKNTKGINELFQNITDILGPIMIAQKKSHTKQSFTSSFLEEHEENERKRCCKS